MKYTNPAIVKQRKALALSLINAGETDIAEALCERLGVRPYTLAECGQSYDTTWAVDLAAALTTAEDNFDASNYNEWANETQWIRVEARDMLTGDHTGTTMTIEPDQPKCSHDDGHDWHSPYSVLGGLKENPGVWGHGGGVIIRAVCRHCGVYRITDTWAQNPETGEQGLTSTSYQDADDASRAWIERNV